MVTEANPRPSCNTARLIITADDGAALDSIDNAIVDLANRRIITCVAAFANFGHLAELGRRIGNSCALSIHLNISSGVPVTAPSELPNLCGRLGRFNTPIELITDPFEPLQSVIARFGHLVLSKVPSSEIRLELTNQLARFIELLGMKPAYSSLHHDLDQLNSVRECFQPPSKLPPARQVLLDQGFLSGYKYVFCQASQSVAEYADLLEDLIKRSLGISYRAGGRPFEIALHPAANSVGLQSFTAYAAERETEYLAWKSEKIRKLLEKGVRSGTAFEFGPQFIGA